MHLGNQKHLFYSKKTIFALTNISYDIMKYLIIAMLMLSTSVMAQDFTIGADTGWNTELESKGHRLYNWKGETRECTALMKEMGMNAIRIRVWVENDKQQNAVGNGWCCNADVLEKAKRAKALGMDVMIDFHYSDWWADPAKQNIPKDWEKHSYKQMLRDVAEHTKSVLTLLRDNGISPRWVQVGNETSHGMLWSVEKDPATGWEKKDANGNTIITKTMGHLDRNPKQYAGFINAGYEAVKSICPDAIVIVHLDNGFDKDLYNRNFDVLKENGAKWDMIGMSLYPYWSMRSGRVSSAAEAFRDCMRNIKALYKKYGTETMITETGFEVNMEQPWVMELGREQLSQLLNLSRTATDGHCRGVFYWEPECNPRQYKLGAFTDKGMPSSIMRGYVNDAVARGDFSLLKNYDRKVVKMVTTRGDIYLELYNETPIHRDNFLRLAKSGSIDSTLFHRVINNFMIQGGDPDSREAERTYAENPAPILGDNDVLTESGEHSIAAELLYPQFFHKRGALAAAREGDDVNPEKRSSSSQFYIVWGKWPVNRGRNPKREILPYYESYQAAGTPWLDGDYTVYGEMLSGFDVVEKIQNAKVDANDRPLDDVRVLRLEVVN